MKITNKADLKTAIENARPHFPKETVRLELYRLASYFFASKKLRDLSDGLDFCPYQSLRDDFESSEIVRILLFLGSAGRLICDEIKDSGNERVVHANVVGKIQDDVKIKKERGLNILEVCSKILHAKLIIPKVRYQGNYYRQYLQPQIILYSDSKRKIGWKVIISLEKFVAAFSNIS